MKRIIDIRNVVGAYAVELTKGSWTLVSPKDTNKVSQHSWCLNGKYANGTVGGKLVSLARWLIECPKHLQVDHINRNTLDNRRFNLRAVTGAQNQWNKGLSRNNTSGYSGVHFDAIRRKWCVSICINGKKKTLGRFAAKQEAIQARQAAELKYRNY